MAFALRILHLTQTLPKTDTGRVLAKQLLRCGTSVGANYRAACRARSRADFIAKMGIVEEECDETIYWMDLLIRGNVVDERLLTDLKEEANALLAITVTSIKTARSRK